MTADHRHARFAGRAMRLAALDADLAGLTHGANTEIGELGVRLSGGQRQRIVAALREAFGSQRPESERTTILLCSQRLAAFPLADRVVVLENGRIEEAGTHDALLARGGLYARIFRAQTRSGLAIAAAS
jgi:ATP-binding cassette subfamily B multidrug efflux pump